ncbi:hypothetical protein SALBM135S_06332 [Streptomyces alboniger]
MTPHSTQPSIRSRTRRNRSDPSSSMARTPLSSRKTVARRSGSGQVDRGEGADDPLVGAGGLGEPVQVLQVRAQGVLGEVPLRHGPHEGDQALVGELPGRDTTDPVRSAARGGSRGRRTAYTYRSSSLVTLA